jgi:hypothetical protein
MNELNTRGPVVDNCHRALLRIRYLSRPGQTLTLQMAIDLLCDVWNISDSVIKGDKDEQTD